MKMLMYQKSLILILFICSALITQAQNNQNNKITDAGDTFAEAQRKRDILGGKP